MTIGTIVAACLLAAAVVLAAGKIYRDKKKGRGGCSFGCSSCAMKDSCHKRKGDQND